MQATGNAMWCSILGFGLFICFGIYDTSAERVMLSGPIHAFSNDIFARLGQKETGKILKQVEYESTRRMNIYFG